MVREGSYIASDRWRRSIRYSSRAASRGHPQPIQATSSSGHHHHRHHHHRDHRSGNSRDGEQTSRDSESPEEAYTGRKGRSSDNRDSSRWGDVEREAAELGANHSLSVWWEGQADTAHGFVVQAVASFSTMVREVLHAESTRDPVCEEADLYLDPDSVRLWEKEDNVSRTPSLFGKRTCPVIYAHLFLDGVLI